MYSGKVVIVTGAGKGIGRSIAIAYAKHHAKVVIVDKEAEALQDTAQLINQANGESFMQIADLRNPSEIEQFVKNTAEHYGRIDILINNAGISFFKPLFELTIKEWDAVINTNLRGAFLCAREAAKIMRTNGGGAIVNIASTRAIMSEPHSEAYAASKGGLLSLTHALAISLGSDNIRVNAISPGWIETGDYDHLKKQDHLQHPAQRVGRPEDIARACLFLTDPNHDFITGTNLVIDGGMTRKMIYEE